MRKIEELSDENVQMVASWKGKGRQEGKYMMIIFDIDKWCPNNGEKNT